MAIVWEALTVDARDPVSLAQWWAQTLDWHLVEPDPAGVEVRSPDGRSSSLFFVPVDDAKQTKNRLHLDLYANDQAAAVAALRRSGGHSCRRRPVP